MEAVTRLRQGVAIPTLTLVILLDLYSSVEHPGARVLGGLPSSFGSEGRNVECREAVEGDQEIPYFNICFPNAP